MIMKKLDIDLKTKGGNISKTLWKKRCWMNKTMDMKEKKLDKEKLKLNLRLENYLSHRKEDFKK
ncbi:hypothetical protein HYD86_01040 [Mycoplasmopsis bovis]|nr:hypothetical protein [Mycoplasmopsis bovis]QQH36823.1 hypothetical protein HYD86_01040 [Mycoplasmopsis bovis]